MQIIKGQTFDNMLMECIETCADNHYQNASAESIERKYKFFAKELAEFRAYPEAVKFAFMTHLMTDSNGFPKISDIKTRVKIPRNANVKPGQIEFDGTWYSWLMTEAPSDCKYYLHKVEGWQKEAVLKRLKLAGVQPEPLTNCKGYMEFKKFVDDMGSGKIGNFGKLEAVLPGITAESKFDTEMQKKFDKLKILQDNIDAYEQETGLRMPENTMMEVG